MGPWAGGGQTAGRGGQIRGCLLRNARRHRRSAHTVRTGPCRLPPPPLRQQPDQSSHGGANRHLAAFPPRQRVPVDAEPLGELLLCEPETAPHPSESLSVHEEDYTPWIVTCQRAPRNGPRGPLASWALREALPAGNG